MNVDLLMIIAGCFVLSLSTEANLNANHGLRLEWAEMESNHPSPKTADLQSALLPLQYIHPNIKSW